MNRTSFYSLIVVHSNFITNFHGVGTIQIFENQQCINVKLNICMAYRVSWCPQNCHKLCWKSLEIEEKKRGFFHINMYMLVTPFRQIYKITQDLHTDTTFRGLCYPSDGDSFLYTKPTKYI